MADLKGCWALVTGASSGLGVDFARELAKRGANLVLVARREAPMRELGDALTAAHGVSVEVVAMDLSAQDAPQRLFNELTERDRAIDVLINNAGFGLYGNFLEIDWARERNMIELDIVTLVQMTRLFAAPMVARNRGWILQVSSIGGYQPSPTYATYAAAKSFVLSYGEAIAYELRRTNVRCTVLSPGVTATEFLKNSGQQATLYQRLVMMTSEEVARTGIEAMLKGKLSVLPGIFNKLAVFGNRFLPRRAIVMVANALMKSESVG